LNKKKRHKKLLESNPQPKAWGSNGENDDGEREATGLAQRRQKIKRAAGLKFPVAGLALLWWGTLVLPLVSSLIVET